MTLDIRLKLEEISSYSFYDEILHLKTIEDKTLISFKDKTTILKRADELIDSIVNDSNFSLEHLLKHYNLSTEEGNALISLSESFIRIPDKSTALELANDKLLDKKWHNFIDFNLFNLVNLTSLGLYIVSKIINKSQNKLSITNLTNPIILKALAIGISFIGKEFIIGEHINDAITRSKKSPKWKFSFDLLGEGSRTFAQAEIYFERYLNAVHKLQDNFAKDQYANIHDRPNLSVKLTALYPRFELVKIDDIKSYLLPKLEVLLEKAYQAGISISFDAEEASRLDLYIEILTALILNKKFNDFSGIGFVVQAYQKRSLKLLEYILELAKQTGKIIPVRLVKGAYWDSEIKAAQIMSLEDYPVFTEKYNTDQNYLACAKLMLENTEYIYPQFATHNAITASIIETLGSNKQFEFQKLYGMGDNLHEELVKKHNVRIYAPIGDMNDLLAYLMRRMLENGANNSFIHKIHTAPKENILEQVTADQNIRRNDNIPLPFKIYNNRLRTIGFDLGEKMHIDMLSKNILAFNNKNYDTGSIINGKQILTKQSIQHFRPAKIDEPIGTVSYITEKELINTLDIALESVSTWSATDVNERSKILNNIADLMEQNQYELLSLLINEAGKSIKDAIAELHEAIDFCRYYALEATKLIQDRIMPGITGEKNILSLEARGVFLCISPWNFPLAIFTGQIVAALVTGNSVIAKAADQTSIIANYTVKLMHQAGVPKSALHLVCISGKIIGDILCNNPKLGGIAFTGSTATARSINLAIANNNGPIIPLIAETGGQNAMIVDSSALLEQVTDDVIASAFYSAGQRCSALRILYIQEEIYDKLLEMIIGAVDTLTIGDTKDFANDIGPVIDKNALSNLTSHIKLMEEKGFQIIAEHHKKGSNNDGYFFYPHIIKVNSINDIPEEKFGPILHVTKYKAENLDNVIQEINQYGYGLTFGIHTRIENKIEYMKSKMKVGNIYANRSIIGAQVESQPFGGRNLSGTGFKAGGPFYLLRFLTEKTTSINLTAIGGNIDLLSK